MPIVHSPQDGLFTIHTQNTTYQIKAGPHGYLQHLYYGARVDGQDLSYRIRPVDRGFSGNPYEVGDDRTFSLDTLPLEYPCAGVGDYRKSAIAAVQPDGSQVVDLRYASWKVLPGKYTVDGMPALYESEEGECETLVITLRDRVCGLEVQLLYGVFAQKDIITRAALAVNRGEEDIRLTQVQSASLDFLYGEWDLVHFHGRHCMEREFERVPVMHGVQSIGSRRGTSSHQHNPALILCDRAATEDFGACYGVNLVYSGNFNAYVEGDQTGLVRVGMGLGGDGFCHVLGAGESFATPEAVLSFSADGFAALSHNYHRIYRHNLCRGKYQLAPRPVLVNNWEATYFDFDSDKLVAIAESAAALGIDMLVMDDGWFGERGSDDRALGDWFVNNRKLRGGLKPLVERVNSLGLKFGIWVEPEMVSENSDLYRAHPDWALRLPGRKPTRARYQLVLDLSRENVRRYLFESLCAVLDSAPIEYVKWDMNRSICDWYSHLLPADRQGELPHRYMLGVYDLLDRLTARYPAILFEGCSGGGGRFDPGMLYYHPQIWCSDDTDAIERLKIQYGTSFFYPVSTMGSHVSAVPNHQTGRRVPLETRGVVSMTGAFGYELDLTALTPAEQATARQQVRDYKRLEPLIHGGLYYRLSSPYQNTHFTAWQVVSEDKRISLLSVVIASVMANSPHIHLRLKGLDPHRVYLVDGAPITGSALMNGGYVPALSGHYAARQILIEAVE